MTVIPQKMFHCLVLISLLFAASCARLPVTGPEAERLTVERVARLDSGRVYAITPDGGRLAYVRDGLHLLRLADGDDRVITPKSAVALAWSADGALLAAATALAEGSELEVYNSDGKLLHERKLPGAIGALFWPAPEVVAAMAMEFKGYSFGVSLRESLLRWALPGEISTVTLHETVLKPTTARQMGGAALLAAMHPVVSPLGDELLYNKLLDPPAFVPYMNNVIRNLTGNRERVIGSDTLRPAEMVFSADGEVVYKDNGVGQPVQIVPWSEGDVVTAPLDGRVRAVCGNNCYLFADGRVVRDGRLLARFPPLETGFFTDDGRLLITCDGTLYRVSGLTVAPRAQYTGNQADQLRLLRGWRASGLISADDYRTAREKVLQ